MTMDLYPNNEDVFDEAPDYPVGFWSWLMFDAGVGEAIGLRRHDEPGKFVYKPDTDGLCPMYNDGFSVSMEEARKMSVIATGAIDRFPDKADALRRFARFCERSGGFSIN